MEEKLLQLERKLNELQDWKNSLERSSTIPLAIDQAFRERFREYKILFGQDLLDFSSVNAGSAGTKTINVIGARVNDPCLVSPQLAISSNTGRIFQAYCASDGVVTIQFDNQTGSSIDLDPMTFKVAVFQKISRGEAIK